jgi:hypothetical protein
MNLTFLLASTSLVLFCTHQGFAADLKGVRFPDQETLNGRTLHLNGVASLEKTIFNIDVLAAGLYLETPANSGTDVVDTSELKKVVIVFLRDVSAKQIAKEWKSGFSDNCGTNCSELQPQFARVQALLTDVKRGQEVQLTFYPDRLAISSKGRSQVVSGRQLAEVLLATFIGPKAGDKDIKRGLLSAGHIEHS